LLGTNGFHVKAENERFPGAVSRCRQNFKYENFTLTHDRPRQKIAPKGVPHVQHDYFFFIQPIKSLICGVVDVDPNPNSLMLLTLAIFLGSVAMKVQYEAFERTT